MTPTPLSPLRYQRTALVLGGCCQFLLLTAGLSKLADLPSFARELQGWTLLPPFVRALVTPTLPSLEVLIPLLWVLSPCRRRAANIAAICLVLLLSLGLIAQNATGSMTDCGCLGVLAEWLRLRQDFESSLARNAVMIGLLTTSVVISRSPRKTDANASSGHLPASVGVSRTSAGFSLIELLVVIAIVSVLIALVIIGLRQTRQDSRQVVDLANLRTHASAWNAYATDSRDMFPFFVPVDPGERILEVPDVTSVPLLYFEQSLVWHHFMLDRYGVPWSAPVFQNPAWPRTDIRTSYRSPCTFRVDPAQYNSDTTSRLPHHARAIGVHEVMFPAAKILIFRMRTANEPDFNLMDGTRNQVARSSAAFADAHAQVFQVSRSNPAVWKAGDTGLGGLWMGSHPPDGGFSPWFHTRDGVRGRDLK